jgi:hypothetical protein
MSAGNQLAETRLSLAVDQRTEGIEMAICDNCANKRDCTFPHTETTHMCEEYDASEHKVETVEWNLSEMLAGWGFKTEERA